MMKYNDDLKQDAFISDEGHINIRLKVTTDNTDEREEIIRELMGGVYNAESFNVPKHTILNQLYFTNKDPLTVLKELKEQMVNLFDKNIKSKDISF